MSFNRVASFFVYLEARGLVDGETWFPFLDNTIISNKTGSDEVKWAEGEDGGIKFVPRRGSALFWVNLHRNGTGDARVRHAGLPLVEGRKTALNIWPRVFFGI